LSAVRGQSWSLQQWLTSPINRYSPFFVQEEDRAVTQNNDHSGGLSRRGFFEGVASFAALASMTNLPHAAAEPASRPLSIESRTRSLAKGIEQAMLMGLKRNSARYPLGEASTIVHVLQNLQLGLAMNYVNADPARPTLFNYMNPHVKQGGDNTDAFYSGFAVDARNTYRLHGKLGGARYVSFTTVERDDSTPWGGAMGAALYGHEMEVEPDGSFEVIVSAKPHEGNWLRITESDFRVTVRQFFADWENEAPMSVMVELVGESGIEPIANNAENMMQAMEASVEWLHTTVNFWQDVIDMYRQHPNAFKSWRELTGDGVNATPGGDPDICYWNIPEGKALILRVRPPECLFWNVEFNNPWWETMDYRFHLAGTNNHHAVLEDDGEVILVAAHEDPGLPNWLDTCGHTEGMMGRRWMFAKENPRYSCTLVDFDQLDAVLPAGVKRITPEARKEQLAARRRGLYKRFVTL
jgi:hypothetical protein